MKTARAKDLSSVPDGSGNWHRDGVRLHDVFELIRVVEHGIEAANILIAEFTEADSQKIAPRQKPDQLSAAEDRQMMDTGELKQLSRLRYRIIQVEVDNVFCHDVRDGIILAHSGAFGDGERTFAGDSAMVNIYLIQGGATSVPAAVQEVGNATLMLIPRSPDVMSRTQVRHFPGFGELHVCAKSARCINFNYEMCDAWPH